MIDKDKIYKYVNITFKIILTISIILSISKSCAKALSYDEILDYVTRTAAYYPNNSTYQTIKTQISTVAFENSISQYASGYDSVYIYWIRGSTYQPAVVYCYMFNDSDGILTGNGQLYCNGSYCIISKPVNSSSTYNPSTGTGQQNMDGCFKTTANQENSLIGMCYTNYTIEHMPATFVGNQAIPQYTYLEFDNSMIDNTAYNGNIFTYYFKGNIYNQTQIKLGNIINNDSYYYECKFKDNNNIEIGTSFVSLNINPIDIYNTGAIKVTENQEIYVNTLSIDYSKQYQLEITSYYGDGGTELYEDIDWFIFLPQNAIISGDYITSIGNGDFTNKDSTGLIIDNNNTFLTELTYKLFKVESGDMQNIINNIKEKYNYSGDEEVEKQILEIAKQTNGDFKITWNAFTPHFSIKGQLMNYEKPMIPSGEINFSKIERENESLKETMKWTRLILAFALITLITREYTKLLLDAVGASVLLADHDKDSNRIIDGGDQK